MFFVDGKRAGGMNATFMRVSVDATCKKVLSEFLSLHATELFPLPDTTTVIMTCVKNINTIHGRPNVDVG
jgi:hypothetical protein